MRFSAFGCCDWLMAMLASHSKIDIAFGLGSLLRFVLETIHIAQTRSLLSSRRCALYAGPA